MPKGFTNKNGNHPSNAWKWLSENYPAIAAYLKPFENAGKKRFDKGDYWWELRACDYYNEFEKEKIIYPNILKQPEFTLDINRRFTNQKCFVISSNDRYLLGFLNSRLNYYLFENYLPKLRGGFYEPSYVFFKKFPVKLIDISNKREKELQSKIIENVNRVLSLNTELKKTSIQSTKDQILTHIEYCEENINTAIYKLYDLTTKEINIIEQTLSQNVNNETETTLQQKTMNQEKYQLLRTSKQKSPHGLF